MSRRSKRFLIITPIVIALGILIWGAFPHGRLIIRPPPTDAEPERWVNLEGSANTRDAGGYVTPDGHLIPHGMIYRSAALSHLSLTGTQAYRKLGIRTVIDFRNRVAPWPLFGGDMIQVQLASTVYGCRMSFKSDVPRRQFNVRGVSDNAASFRKAFELLSHGENYPVLYHCSRGTDRTGAMSALLLSLLGVDRATIMADFRLSERVGLPGDPEAMAGLLDQIEQQGIRQYLAGIGVTSETQDRIRAILLPTK